jgi:hypothetical protein
MKTLCPTFKAQITEAFTDYFQAISSHDLKKIETTIHLIEALEKSAPSDIPKELKHYLERKSYRKAFDWIQSSHLSP